MSFLAGLGAATEVAGALGSGGSAVPGSTATSAVGGPQNAGIRFAPAENDHSRVIQTAIVMGGVVLVAIAARSRRS